MMRSPFLAYILCYNWILNNHTCDVECRNTICLYKGCLSFIDPQYRRCIKDVPILKKPEKVLCRQGFKLTDLAPKHVFIHQWPFACMEWRSNEHDITSSTVVHETPDTLNPCTYSRQRCLSLMYSILQLSKLCKCMLIQHINDKI